MASFQEWRLVPRRKSPGVSLPAQLTSAFNARCCKLCRTATGRKRNRNHHFARRALSRMRRPVQPTSLTRPAMATGNQHQVEPHQVPGASTNVEINGNGGFHISVRMACGLQTHCTSAALATQSSDRRRFNARPERHRCSDGPKRRMLDLLRTARTLMAGSITGTITVDNNAVISGSSGSTIAESIWNTGPWAEVITSATILHNEQQQDCQ